MNNYNCLFSNTIIKKILDSYFIYYQIISEFDFKVIVSSIDHMGRVCKEWYYNIIPKLLLPIIKVNKDVYLKKYLYLVRERKLEFNDILFIVDPISHDSLIESLLSHYKNQKYINTVMDTTSDSNNNNNNSNQKIKIKLNAQDKCRIVFNNTLNITLDPIQLLNSSTSMIPLDRYVDHIVGLLGSKDIIHKLTFKGEPSGKVLDSILTKYSFITELKLQQHKLPSSSISPSTTSVSPMKCVFNSSNLDKLFLHCTINPNSYQHILEHCLNLSTLGLHNSTIDCITDQLMNHPSITHLTIEDSFNSSFILKVTDYLNINKILYYLCLLNNNSCNNNNNSNSFNNIIQENSNISSNVFKRVDVNSYVENNTLGYLSFRNSNGDRGSTTITDIMLIDVLLRSWKTKSKISTLLVSQCFPDIFKLHSNIKRLSIVKFIMMEDYSMLSQAIGNHLNQLRALCIDDYIFYENNSTLNLWWIHNFFKILPNLLSLEIHLHYDEPEIFSMFSKKIDHLVIVTHNHLLPLLQDKYSNSSQLIQLCKRYSHLLQFKLYSQFKIQFTNDDAIQSFANFILANKITSLYFNFQQSADRDRFFSLLI
ncbi:hypothetical protein CYY_007443 [Polysphondylium violaceum]|uniref:Uncharacterized protein n=1 Tax=Polysphondylium violaceum TaxID=133409 RepID=A0A8J4PQT4_9MYCE|nr:hypothetical protein CYY_007443 [Polysphondylium violaceum]